MERQLKKQNEPDQEHQKERSEAEKKEFEKKRLNNYSPGGSMLELK